MTIGEIANVISADVVCGEDFLTREVPGAFGSDMMSEVLAFANDQSLLITGLCNSQVIRTAEMMDMTCICFVRGKMPDAEMIKLAKERNMVILATKKRMFDTCGLLYEIGLRGGGK